MITPRDGDRLYCLLENSYTLPLAMHGLTYFIHQCTFPVNIPHCCTACTLYTSRELRAIYTRCTNPHFNVCMPSSPSLVPKPHPAFRRFHRFFVHARGELGNKATPPPLLQFLDPPLWYHVVPYLALRCIYYYIYIYSLHMSILNAQLSVKRGSIFQL